MSNTVKARGRILTSVAEIREAVKEAKKRERTATKILLAHYDKSDDTVVVNLSTGATLIVPRREIAGFAKAKPRQLAVLEITPERECLWSEAVDDGVLLEQLIVLAFGNETLGGLGGRINGSKKSPARAAASRANGAKGGRPRKSAA